jgi:predicted DNA-binding protein
MPVSLRIPHEKDELIKKAAARSGKTKTAVILEAVDASLGLTKSRDKKIREMAGWLTKEEANELRRHTKLFRKINRGDWT